MLRKRERCGRNSKLLRRPFAKPTAVLAALTMVMTAMSRLPVMASYGDEATGTAPSSPQRVDVSDLRYRLEPGAPDDIDRLIHQQPEAPKATPATDRRAPYNLKPTKASDDGPGPDARTPRNSKLRTKYLDMLIAYDLITDPAEKRILYKKIIELYRQLTGRTP